MDDEPEHIIRLRRPWRRRVDDGPETKVDLPDPQPPTRFDHLSYRRQFNIPRHLASHRLRLAIDSLPATGVTVRFNGDRLDVPVVEGSRRGGGVLLQLPAWAGELNELELQIDRLEPEWPLGPVALWFNDE